MIFIQINATVFFLFLNAVLELGALKIKFSRDILTFSIVTVFMFSVCFCLLSLPEQGRNINSV